MQRKFPQTSAKKPKKQLKIFAITVKMIKQSLIGWIT